MTDEQREAVDALAAAGGCPAAEAIRRLIDGAPVPQARSTVSMDPEQYRDVLEGVQAVRTDLNRGLGNWYRLVRDSYAGHVPSESEVGWVREGLENGLSDLATLSRAVSRWSPW